MKGLMLCKARHISTHESGSTNTYQITTRPRNKECTVRSRKNPVLEAERRKLERGEGSNVSIAINLGGVEHVNHRAKVES